jgi:predicted transcriptional regulator of viral defense system
MSQASFFVSIDELIGRYVHAQVVYIAAKLGLADLMGDRPRTIENVAALVEVDPDALRRMMSRIESLF